MSTAEYGGGKKESDTIIFLQTCLLLNTIGHVTNEEMRHKIPIGALHPYAGSYPQTYFKFLQCSLGICLKQPFLHHFTPFQIFPELQISKSLNSFSRVLLKIFRIFPPLQNILFPTGISLILEIAPISPIA